MTESLIEFFYGIRCNNLGRKLPTNIPQMYNLSLNITAHHPFTSCKFRVCKNDYLVEVFLSIDTIRIDLCCLPNQTKLYCSHLLLYRSTTFLISAASL